MKIKLESIFFTIMMTAFIFNLKYKGLPSSFFIISFIFLILAFYYFINGYDYPKKLVKPLIFFILFLISLLFTILVTSNIDIFLVSLLLGIVFVVTVVPYALLSHFKGREIEIVKFIIYAGIINAFFIIIMFLSSGFREFYLSLLSHVDLLYVKGEDALNSLYAMRLIGLTGSATYGMAVLQVVMAFLYVFYIRMTKHKFTFFNSLILLILMLSAILSGRTAFVGFVFLFIYIFLVLNKKELLKFIFTSIVAFSLFLIFTKLFLPENFYSFFKNWILQLFIVGETVGSVEINKSILSVYGFSAFSLLGDFKWHADELRNSYYMSTDVGWFRFLFAFGFIGLFFLMLYILSLINIKIRFKSQNLISFFIIIFLLLVMFKGAILFDFYQIFFVFTILYFIISRTRQ